LAKSRFRLAFVSSCLLALTGGCRFFPASNQSAGQPGYVTVGIESQPLSLDPRFATDANSVRVGGLIYNSLLRADARGQLGMEVAEHWWMADPRTYVFELRPDVTFHDGRRLTAGDVKYTYDSVRDARTGSPKRALLKPLEVVEALTPRRVRFRLSEPHAPFVEQFTIGIVPADSGYGTPNSRTPPVGSGPFVFASSEPGENVVLKANPSYWDGPPKVAGLVFKIIPDAMVRVLEFKHGSIDFLQNDIEPDMLPWLRENTSASVDTRQGTTFQYIGVNLAHPILRHLKVRQAIAHAIDREQIIRHLLKDLGIPASGLLSPLNWAYEGAVDSWPYDPQRAKQLLDEAGFVDADGDGPKPRFRLSFKTTNIDLRRRIAEAFKEQLRSVGIELEIRDYEWGTFYSDVKKGNFHLFSLAWVGIIDPDIYFQLFHSGSVPPNGDNRGRYANAALDRLLERGRLAVEPEERRAIYSQVQKIVARELPYIPLWWAKNVIVQQAALRGFVPYPDGDLISLKDVSFHSPATAGALTLPCAEAIRKDAARRADFLVRIRDSCSSAHGHAKRTPFSRGATKPMCLFQSLAGRPPT
jgi:peptide/nickel transport system substrate-binding protein